MAGTGSLYRLDATGGTEATALVAGQIIEFNQGTSPDANGNLVSTSVRWIEDVSIHPTPNVHLSKIQTGKLGTKEVTIAGYFTNPDTSSQTGGIFKFNNWMANDKTNTDLKFGRFGLRLDNMSVLNLTPSGTIGYLLHDVYIEQPDDSPNEATFIAKLYLNGSAV